MVTTFQDGIYDVSLVHVSLSYLSSVHLKVVIKSFLVSGNSFLASFGSYLVLVSNCSFDVAGRKGSPIVNFLDGLKHKKICKRRRNKLTGGRYSYGSRTNNQNCPRSYGT